jgi:FMN phosphatase YigB (HAD superfamily)
MSSEPTPIDYLAIDIDNCLVPYDAHYVQYITDAIIDTVLEVDSETRNQFNGDRDLVVRLANDYYHEYGQSILGFAIQNHMSVPELSRRYHTKLDPKEIINPTQEQLDQLKFFTSWVVQAKREGIIQDYVALTQSTVDWARKVLYGALGLKDTFNERSIVSSDRYSYGFKHNDVRPYSEIMIAMNVHHKDRILVIDDSRSVLRFAFEKMGMQTCLISHGAHIEDEHKPYLSAIANNISDVPRIVEQLSHS